VPDPVFRDTTSPVLQSITSNVGRTEIYLTYNKSLFNSVPAAARFTISSGVISAVAVNLVTVTLTLSTAFTAGATLGYTVGANPIQDNFSNLAASFAAQSITTGGAAPENLIFSTRTSNVAPSGNNYVATSPSAATTFILADKKIPAGQDGYVSMRWMSSSNNSVLLGFNTTDVNASAMVSAGSSNPFEFVVWTIGGQLRTAHNGGTVVNPAISVAAGDRIRIARTGTVFTVDVSPNGTVWTNVSTYPITNAGDLFVGAAFDGTELNNPQILGGVNK
jgi:hypothetical protein